MLYEIVPMINIRKVFTKILLFALILIPSVSFSASPYIPGPLFVPGQTLDPGCLPSNPDCAVSTSTASVTYVYASSTFPSFTYASSTFPSFTYGSTTYYLASNPDGYLTLLTASSSFLQIADATSTYPSFGYASTTYLTLSSASTDYVSTSTALSTYLSIASATLAYVPYTGANADVNLGTNNLITNGLIENSSLVNNINLSANSSTLYLSDYPPAQNGTYVVATTQYSGLFVPYFATDPTKSLTGNYNSWLSANYSNTNQRFHIDLGSAKTVTKIYYENYHDSGSFTNQGVKNFTLWGSNTPGDFADTVYADDGTWVQLTTSQSTFDQHVALNQVDPKYITVTNTTPYRYYAFKFADNWNSSYSMGVRRIELQESAAPYNTTFTTNNLQRMTILNNGNVGIGTLTPTYNLDVVGNMNASNGIYINGVLVSTSSLIGITQSVSPYLTAYGVGAGATSTGAYNTFIGYQAGNKNTTGNYNTANGYQALFSNTTGKYNTANGYYSLYSNATGSNNTANGYNALRSTLGSNNIGLGYYAGYYETGTSTLYIDNLNRGSLANGKSQSLIYGVSSTTLSAQILTFNASTTVNGNLTVLGNQSLTGAFFDSTNASGTAGMILQSTGTSTLWVATSTLGIGGNLSGGTINQLTYWTSANTIGSLATGTEGLFLRASSTSVTGFDWASASSSNVSQWTTNDSNIYYNGGNVGIGTTTPTDAKLSIYGTSGSSTDLFGVASSSGSRLFTITSAGNVITNGLIENSTLANSINLSAVSSIPFLSDYPLVQNGTYATATTQYSSTAFPYFATDPTKSLIGSSNYNSWNSANGSTTNQRFHIDLGSAKTITRIYYENGHGFGDATNFGVKNFTLWGSNTVGAFSDTAYADDANWTQLTTATSSFDQHVSLDQADPKYITVTNTTAYRYYAFKFADNWGNLGSMGVRRIELQEAIPNGITFSTNNLQRMTILNNGNVGIGTSTPSSALTVNGSTTISSLTAGIVKSTSGGSLYTDSSTYLTANNIADIGIYNNNKNPLLYWSSWTNTPTVIKTIIIASSSDYGTWDGKNLWVGSHDKSTISKVDQDANVLATYTLPGINPLQMAYDGRYIWVGSSDYLGQLVKFDPITGTTIATYVMNPSHLGGMLNGGVQSVIWDGTNIWVGVSQYTGGAGSGFVAKLDSSGNIIASSTGQTNVNGMAFTDIGGIRYIWAANEGFISKIKASDMTYSTTSSGGTTYRIATDGQYIYGADFYDNAIYKFSVQDGSLVATWPSGYHLNTMAYDGKYIWTAGDDDVVTIHDKDTGAIVYTIPNGGRSDLIFDGTYMWSISRTDGSVRKITLGNLNANVKFNDNLSILSTGATTTSVYLSSTSTGSSYVMNKFGVGTSTPGAKLDIYGAAGTSDIFAVSSSSNSRLVTITSAGNVGIGTSTPSSALTIVGDLYATGTLKGSNLTALGNNVLLGIRAGAVNAAGNNTFIGYEAGKVNVSGFQNTFVGSEAGYSNVTNGDWNTFIGQGAGRGNTIGFQNTYVGQYSGLKILGSNNAFFGTDSGYNINSGSNNTILGTKAGSEATDGSDNVFIGYQAGMYESGSNKLYIANTLTSNPLIYGDFASSTLTVNGKLGIGTSTPSANLTASGTIRFTSLGSGGGNLITDSLGNVTVSSDERLKDIQNNYERGLSDIMKITPISYKWKEETGYDTTNVYTGFSAQNMQLAIPEAVSTSSSGYLTLADRPIIAALVNAVKEIGSFITKIENGIAYLKDIVIERLTVGSDATPAGITMYDRTTKQPYCVFMNNGSWSNEQGKCPTYSATSTINNIATIINAFGDISTPATEQSSSTESTSTEVMSTSTPEVTPEAVATTTEEIIPDASTTTEVVVPETPVEEVATTTPEIIPEPVIEPPVEVVPEVIPETPIEIFLAPLEEATTTNP